MRAKGVKLTLAAAILLCTVAFGKQIDVPSGDVKGTAANHSGQPVADIKDELKTETKVLPFETKYEFSRSVGQGRMVRRQAGQNGQVVETYRILRENGRVVGRELVKKETVPAVDEVVHIGRQGFTTSRSSFNRKKVLVMEATAYDPSAGRGAAATFRTANGMRARYGLVAVDPRVIPLGTMVYVEGYGIALAADTGGAIKGMKIDLCVNTYREAIQFGRRKVRVHILK